MKLFQKKQSIAQVVRNKFQVAYAEIEADLDQARCDLAKCPDVDPKESDFRKAYQLLIIQLDQIAMEFIRYLREHATEFDQKNMEDDIVNKTSQLILIQKQLTSNTLKQVLALIKQSCSNTNFTFPIESDLIYLIKDETQLEEEIKEKAIEIVKNNQPDQRGDDLFRFINEKNN